MIRLCVVCRGTRYFLEPLVTHWKGKYEFVGLARADVVWVEWANEQVVLISQATQKRNVVCRILGSEYYQNFWKSADVNKIFAFASENPEYQLPGFPVRYIPEPIDTEFWKSDASVKRVNRLVLVGGYIYSKNALGLLRLIAEDPKFFDEVVIVGDMDPPDVDGKITVKKIMRQLEWYAIEYKISLTLLNKKTREEMREIYRSSSVVVTTSFNEGCQTCIQEAMSCGTSVLVQDWMGASGIFPRETIFSTASEFWNRLHTLPRGETMRSYAQSKFSQEVVFPQIDSLIEQAADCK